MDTATVSSTFLLTALMLVGLVFFIRASVKDRTESVRLASDQSVEALHQSLRDYLEGRSYRVKAFEGEEGIVTWEGFVQSSLGLALFLSLLASIGLVCLALVLTLVVPSVGPLWFSLVLLAPLAGLFYWKKASRIEQVSYRIRPDEASGSTLTLSAHRDEIISLRQQLSLGQE